MSERARAYRFKTVAQWQRCILHGIDVGRDGVLQPIARLGSTARVLTKAGPVSLVAADLRRRTRLASRPGRPPCAAQAR